VIVQGVHVAPLARLELLSLSFIYKSFHAKFQKLLYGLIVRYKNIFATII
jgi:hypothetical protein